MTKTQARSKIRKLLDIISDLQVEVDDLKCEAEDTAENIEPYEGSYDLTEEQEERQEWFESLSSTLQDLYDNLDSAYCELDEVVSY